LYAIDTSVENTPSKVTTNSVAPNSSNPSNITNEPTAELQSPPRTETMEIVTNMLSSPPGGTHEDPDLDFYQERWLRSLTYLILFGIVLITTFILFVPAYGAVSEGAQLTYFIPTALFINWLPVSSLLGIVSYISLSLLLKEMFPIRFNALLHTLNFYFLIIYISGPLWSVLSIGQIFAAAGFATGLMLYVGLSIYYIRGAKVTK
jgi:hypothetical protein